MFHLVGEATEYDKKQLLEVKKQKSWCKSVSAFANTMEALIFGISDDGDIIGIDHPDADAEKMNNKQNALGLSESSYSGSSWKLYNDNRFSQ